MRVNDTYVSDQVIHIRAYQPTVRSLIGNIYALYPAQAEDLVLHLIVPGRRIKRENPESGRSHKVVTALLWDSKLGKSVVEAEQRTLPCSVFLEFTCHVAVGLLARKLQKLANEKAK